MRKLLTALFFLSGIVALGLFFLCKTVPETWDNPWDPEECRG